ncbi:MAG: hypothetical protein KDD04_08495, partial [Sinomicrobium sp.]|nr:hypothetical protein [Sinomicrobium sp.]
SIFVPMKKIIHTTGFIFLILAACREKEGVPVAENPTQQQQEQYEGAAEPPAVLILKPDYEAEVKKWEAFHNLEIEMLKFEKADRQEGLLILEDLLNLEKQLSASDFPEQFNIPAVKSRILLLKTYLLQTKAEVGEAADDVLFNTQKTKIITAFNAIKKQLAETLPDATEQLLKDLEEQLKKMEQ